MSARARFPHNTTAAGCLSNIRPQFSLGCLEASRAKLDGRRSYYCGHYICCEIRADNTVKALEAQLHLYPFCFQAFIGTSGTKLLKFFRTAAGPVNHYAIDLVAGAESKCDWQLRLGEIAGTTPNHSRLRLPLIENANGSADGVAIGLQPSQVKSNALIARHLIVPV